MNGREWGTEGRGWRVLAMTSMPAMQTVHTLLHGRLSAS